MACRLHGINLRAEAKGDAVNGFITVNDIGVCVHLYERDDANITAVPMTEACRTEIKAEADKWRASKKWLPMLAQNRAKEWE